MLLMMVASIGARPDNWAWDSPKSEDVSTVAPTSTSPSALTFTGRLNVVMKKQSKFKPYIRFEWICLFSSCTASSEARHLT